MDLSKTSNISSGTYMRGITDIKFAPYVGLILGTEYLDRCSKTITAIKAPTLASARVPSSTSGVSHSALDVPMAMAIQDGAAQIAILEARVAEQDGMELTPPKLEDPPAIKGLMFEHSQVEPKGPQTSIE
ncbi:uncharacterized protein HD556DRAFT_1302869 [Suillus plorans]|uniref:Uncharacterized protein n=1 Tax=Suillus plorans TaxID=116603 RepID=A0A9P7DY73_9AGAM|nr:uncharacterized protein HD556DRAFT_1302869 [Suillus plorans]KAG1806379.1 hypothetical protein HD556DRAFT_1302869 [Suillus plorans]